MGRLLPESHKAALLDVERSWGTLEKHLNPCPLMGIVAATGITSADVIYVERLILSTPKSLSAERPKQSPTDTHRVYTDPMDDTEDQICPETQELIASIDRALSAVAGRTIVSTQEMADLLLDIRTEAVGVPCR